MHWKEKLDIARQKLLDDSAFAIVFSIYDCDNTSFANQLHQKYPFLPGDYLDFLKSTNGASFDLEVLGGSDTCSLGAVERATRQWSEIVGDTGIVIGGESSSGMFILSRDGLIRRVRRYIDGTGESTVIATSFSDLMENVLMGRRFPCLFKGPWTDAYENEWSSFLREQGWM